MKENKSIIFLFLLFYGVILMVFFTTENEEVAKQLPVTRIDYQENAKGVNIQAIFDKQEIIALASGIFKTQNVLPRQTFATKTRLILLSEIQDEMSLIEPDVKLIDIYAAYIDYGKLINIVKDQSDEPIADIHDFDEFVELLPKEQNSKQLHELSILKSILNDVQFMGEFDVYDIDTEKGYNLLRTTKLFYNSTHHYRVLLNYSKAGDYTLLVDQNNDMMLDYSYKLSDEWLEIQEISNNENLEQTIYTGFLQIIIDDVNRADIEVNTQRMMLLKKYD